MIRRLRNTYRFWVARRRLEKLVAKARQSYEVESYRRHRAAALKGANASHRAIALRAEPEVSALRASVPFANGGMNGLA